MGGGGIFWEGGLGFECVVYNFGKEVYSGREV